MTLLTKSPLRLVMHDFKKVILVEREDLEKAAFKKGRKGVRPLFQFSAQSMIVRFRMSFTVK